MASYVHERYGCLSSSSLSRRGADRIGPAARVLAGGTDFYPARVGRAIDEDVLDIGGIAILRGIAADRAGWRLGATTTWSELIEADLPPLFDGLKQAAREVGGRQIQNAGTLAGNLCNASPAADGVPPAGARCRGRDRRPRRRPPPAAPAIHHRRPPHRAGAGRAARRHPCAAAPARARSAFLKLGARRYLVISIAMAAATVEIDDGRVASRAASRSAPARRWPSGCRRSKQRLIGAPLDAASPIGSRPRSLRRCRRSTTCAAVRAIAATRSSPCCAACWAASRHEGRLHPERRGAAWDGPPVTRLAQPLRDDLGLTGTKVGCDAGDCGACTVRLDGRQTCACLVAMGQVAGRTIETIEGLADGGVSRHCSNRSSTMAPRSVASAPRAC